MGSKYKEISFDNVHLSSIHDRYSKERVENCVPSVKFTKAEAEKLLDSIPPVLAGNEIRNLINSLRRAKDEGKPCIWTMGAHPVKVSISRHIIALMEAGFITQIGSNGAILVHDTEMSCFGHTSEDVPATITEGKFATTKETGEIVNKAVKRAYEEGMGLGESIGKLLIEMEPEHLGVSIAAAAYRLNIPFTVHLAIGTDVIHIHPEVDGAALGDATHRDFRIFSAGVAELNGGVFVNLGSAVILPVIIEKAIALCRNLGHDLGKFDGYNLDFIHHYRTNLNPVKRAIESGGHGAHIYGHHELNIPLIAAILLAE
ncbi:MAG TPA: hypothetical protein VGB30_01935 [bacterium]|jgi:hypothetical protein